MIGRNTIYLLIRQGVVQCTMILCGILVARHSSPAEFGFYVLCGFLSALLLLAGDLGLGGFLIRSAKVPTAVELNTTFTVRQLVDSLIIVLYLAVTPLIARWYHLSDSGLNDLRALCLVLPLTSFFLIPLVLLEREMNFATIARNEIIQALGFALTLFVSMSLGLGETSFVLAWLFHSATGLVCFQLHRPWRPNWSVCRTFITDALPFSLPYQASAAVYMLRDGVIPILIGAILGPSGVGYANWAQMLAVSIGLGLFVAQRALLPGFARILFDSQTASQEERAERLAASAEFSVRALYSCLLPLVGAVAFYAEPITLLVFNSTWLTALPFFYSLTIANIFFPPIIVGGALLNALGHSGRLLRLLAEGVLVLWVLSAVTLIPLQLWGYCVAFLLSQAVLLRVPLEARKLIPTWKIFNAASSAIVCLVLSCIVLSLLHGGISPQTRLQLFLRLVEFVALSGVSSLALLRLRFPAARRSESLVPI